MYQDICEQQVAGQTESVLRQLEAANVNRAELEKKLAQAKRGRTIFTPPTGRIGE